MESRTTSGDAGYALFAFLVALMILGVGLTAAVPRWSDVLRREREAELVFRGEAIVRAIGAFAEDRPGVLPETLEELVEERYLRKAWIDPVARRPFALVLDPAVTEDGRPRILGVKSAAEGLSLRPWDGARRYQDWEFLHQPASE